MWAALLTVATLSLLTSSAFAAYATYRYFTSEQEPASIALAYPLLSPTRQYGSTWMSMKFDGAPPASTGIPTGLSNPPCPRGSSHPPCAG
jgi:hypothetical protein